MIALTRLSGSVFVLNADLIERVDATPDTVVTLVDGKKYVVREDLAMLVESVLAYRGQIVARGSGVDPTVATSAAPGAPHLAVVPGSAGHRGLEV
ncbi:flagellar FlbD family protein [Nocardioidaceae bacterium]|nr:flagellar FlbD family protein [Nocardioidaceae bacterium]